MLALEAGRSAGLMLPLAATEVRLAAGSEISDFTTIARWPKLQSGNYQVGFRFLSGSLH